MTTPTNCCFKDCSIKEPHTHNVEIVTPKPQSFEERVEAHNPYQDGVSNNGYERTIFRRGASFGRSITVQEIVSWLMETAGNYCSCQNSDRLMCQKHAMTYVAELIETEMKKRGV